MLPRLLVIDDELEICEFIRDAGTQLGFSVVICLNPLDFRSLYLREEPDVVVLDLMMPGVDGIEILRNMAEDGAQAHVVILSGADSRVLQSAKRLGEANKLRMLSVLEKPILFSDLRAVLSKAFHDENAITVDAMRAALENRELIVHYQPKVDLKQSPNWRITGAEALVRWQRPGHGLIYPDAFIPLAEKNGLIAELTQQVLIQAVEQMRAWENAGVSLTVSVNLSPFLLGDLTLPDRIGDLMAEKSLPAPRLTLEITESGVMQDAVRTMEILTRFRLKGFGLSLDDFGTGYSSLVQLHRMPFSEMKIDKSFTMEMDRDEEARKIVTSIAELAQSIGISLCAEGVETRTQLDYLRSLECDSAQGYFFSKPTPVDQFLKLMPQ